ncbi:hypothetical protein K491DRAFT_196970 [Lophiostoma macrostomum CBS 122681]|uniref:Uncharacterized protein n=1 Tax=Lophiostoma macrostomum CBS 122681 TaxID=1314788 RepID=A0A6A6TJJ3_9PLEO|nr:hypothetical protein K491DRAFT_196970 [Lophiostoma macrostomum CBS 122681]
MYSTYYILQYVSINCILASSVGFLSNCSFQSLWLRKARTHSFSSSVQSRSHLSQADLGRFWGAPWGLVSSVCTEFIILSHCCDDRPDILSV